MLKNILVASLFFTSSVLLGQDPFSINYSTADGMPSSNVYSVIQDEFGYIWFTTDVGIVRYDGHRFELFNMDKGLSDNEVFRMRRDSKGRYWLLTLNGKTCYLLNGKIYNETNSSMVRKIASKSFMNCFFEDSQHNIYFIYKNSNVIQLTADGKVIKRPSRKNLLGKEGIWQTGNRLFIFNSTGIYDFETESRIHPFKNKTSQIRFYNTLYGNYFSDFNELYKLGPKNSPVLFKVLPHKIDILNILAESDKIWICTRKGVYLLENNSLQLYFNEDTITAMIKDNEGGYWLSTLNRGVLYIPSFDVLSLTGPIKINCIASNARKEIWFGDDNNNYYIKKNASITKHIAFHDNTLLKVSRIRFFGSNTFVTGKAGILKIDANNNSRPGGFYADDILQDGNQLYVAAGSAFRINENDFQKSIGLSHAFLRRRTNVFCKGNGEIWIGTGYGLYRYRPKDSITFFGTKNPVFDTSIKDLFHDQNTNTLYAASVSKGIIAMRNEKIVHHLTTFNGLNSNSCNKVQKIAEGLFLIGSNNGLNALEIEDGKVKIKNLNPFIGLKNNKINDIHFLDGIVYLATDKGLLSFGRNKIISQKTVSKCLITQLTNQNETRAGNTFSYTENDISIAFNGISFINQGELQYYYRLNQKGHWTRGKESQVNYRSLPAGNYHFEVYCQDGLGNKSNTAAVSFVILSPFWQENWFVVLSILIFAVLLYGFIRFWLKRQQTRFEKESAIIRMERDKARLETQMVELEQKALRLQMNPHFIFNALNTIKGYYSEGDSINASAYISKFSKLLRMLLENTEQAIPLSKEIEMLHLYIHLNKIRYKDKFDYQLEVDENLHPDDVAIPTLLLQPMVENAIIHGLSPKDQKGLLVVSFRQSGKLLECIVSDNGVGRKVSQKNQSGTNGHQSKALEITKERLHLFSKKFTESDIEIIDLEENGVALGTKVIIRIPLLSVWS